MRSKPAARTFSFHIAGAVATLLAIERCGAFSAGSALVPRITLAEYLSSPVHETPVLIRDIAPKEVIESLADELVDVLGQEEVQMQRKIKDDDGSSSTEIYDIALHACIGYMMESSHYDSCFTFCEGLLPSSAPGSLDLSRKLQDIREAPFPGLENWFDYFPPEIKPSDAIILAGAGATSTFHRDPFEWTGTSLCLEGTKIWRFVLPLSESNGGVAVVDEALESYRLDSIAWEDEKSSEEQIVLSAGWQSDMSLYDSIHDEFPSAFEWVTMEEEDNEIFQREMESAGVDASFLIPSADAAAALTRIGKAKCLGDESHEQPVPFVTAIQQPGDLLIIPAYCWHQTYAPLPSVAVASQRCCPSVDGARVVSHMIDISKCDKENVPGVLRSSSYDNGMGKEVVTKL